MLVVGHPGHELRVYGWLRQARPVVHVVTDGSGSDGRSRLGSTIAVLDGVEAARGSIFGRMSDREIYAAILAGDHATFIDLADELAGALLDQQAELVVGDAVEGFNPSHDVCRYLINAAVRLAARASGRRIACYGFPLDAAPDGLAEDRPATLTLELDDTTLDRKLRAALAYPELQAEVETALDRFGAEAFRLECLSPDDLADPYGLPVDWIPFYETYGTSRVASGAYERVVTFRDHVRPLADALWCHSVGHD